MLAFLVSVIIFIVFYTEKNVILDLKNFNFSNNRKAKNIDVLSQNYDIIGQHLMFINSLHLPQMRRNQK